jgi:hypothetical protein
MSKYPTPREPRQKTDLIAFLAVLATGGTLITVGHMTPTALVTTATALTALYSAWKNHRPSQ